MLRFIIRRVLSGIPILLAVSVIVFSLVQLLPGSAIDMLVPPEATQEVVDRLIAEYGFDQPLYTPYVLWLGHVLSGDFGVSVFSGRPISPVLAAALWNTFQLAGLAAILSFTIGAALGYVAARSNGGFLDRLMSSSAIVGVSMPHYWLGIVLVLFFSVMMNWLPAQGIGRYGFPTTWDQIRYMILPVITLSFIPAGIIARLVRATVLEIQNQEFVLTLHAKGLSPRRIRRHIVKNAAPPVLALMGLQLGHLLGGSILVETVFNWPGTGTLLGLAIFRQDLPVIQATMLVIATFFVAINIIVDVMQAAIDPRIRR